MASPAATFAVFRLSITALVFGMAIGVVSAIPRDAGAERFGAWTVETADGWVHASTMSASGDTLFHSCHLTKNGCLWALALYKVPCQVGLKYPLLVNAGTEATAVEAWCLGALGKNKMAYRYGFRDYGLIARLATNTPRIGVAFPVSREAFRIMQFNAAGVASVISATRALAESRAAASRQTKDQTERLQEHD